MKRTKEFIKRNIAGEIVLVPSGQTAREFNGMVTLTETGEFIWEHIEEAESFNHLVLLILEEYEVDKDTASQDARRIYHATAASRHDPSHRYKLVNSNLFNSDMTNNTIRNVRREIRFLARSAGSVKNVRSGKFKTLCYQRIIE